MLEDMFKSECMCVVIISLYLKQKNVNVNKNHDLKLNHTILDNLYKFECMFEVSISYYLKQKNMYELYDKMRCLYDIIEECSFFFISTFLPGPQLNLGKGIRVKMIRSKTTEFVQLKSLLYSLCNYKTKINTKKTQKNNKEDQKTSKHLNTHKNHTKHQTIHNTKQTKKYRSKNIIKRLYMGHIKSMNEKGQCILYGKLYLELLEDCRCSICLSFFFQESLLVGPELNFWKGGYLKMIRSKIQTLHTQHLSYKLFVYIRMANNNTPSTTRKLFENENEICMEIVSVKRLVVYGIPSSQKKATQNHINQIINPKTNYLRHLAKKNFINHSQKYPNKHKKQWKISSNQIYIYNSTDNLTHISKHTTNSNSVTKNKRDLHKIPQKQINTRPINKINLTIITIEKKNSKYINNYKNHTKHQTIHSTKQTKRYHSKNSIKSLLKYYYKNYITNNLKQIEKEHNRTSIHRPYHKLIHTVNTPYHTYYWNSSKITKTLYQHKKHPYYSTKYTNTKIHALLKLLTTNKNRLTKHYKTHRKKPKSTHYEGYHFINKQALLQCGDIESNPGPMPDLLLRHPPTHRRMARTYFIPSTIKLHPEYQHLAKNFAPILQTDHPSHHQTTIRFPHLYQYIQTLNNSPQVTYYMP